MVTKSLRFALIGLSCCVATAFAGSSRLQGVVKDAAGQPVKGAEVRVQTRDEGAVRATAVSDMKGRYATAGLRAGTYRVTLLIDGAPRISSDSTRVKAGEPTEVNFHLAPRAATAAVGSKVRTLTGTQMQRQDPSSNARGLEDDWARRWIWSTH